MTFALFFIISKIFKILKNTVRFFFLSKKYTAVNSFII